jgi:hypothetical protein
MAAAGIQIASTADITVASVSPAGPNTAAKPADVIPGGAAVTEFPAP